MDLNNKFELYTGIFDVFSFTELEDELEEIPNISIITSEQRQHEIVGPYMISAYRKLETEKRQTDFYNMLLTGYARSSIRDFERYLTIVVGLDQDDFWLILKQFISNFVTYEKPPGFLLG